MKRLFLLRHAQASMNAPTDRERPLTEHGVTQAEELGETMTRLGYLPNYVYCSPAKRTRQTFEKLGLSIKTPEFPERLYNAPGGDILSFIQSTNDDVQNLLVVAHNPGIHQMAAMLAADDHEEYFRKVHMAYAPGTLTVLEYKGARWSDIQRGENTILDLIEA